MNLTNLDMVSRAVKSIGRHSVYVNTNDVGEMLYCEYLEILGDYDPDTALFTFDTKESAEEFFSKLNGRVFRSSPLFSVLFDDCGNMVDVNT